MNKENRNYSPGISYGSVLTIVFIVLKLVGVIDWKWIWVFAPMLLEIVIGLLIFLISLYVIWRIDNK